MTYPFSLLANFSIIDYFEELADDFAHMHLLYVLNLTPISLAYLKTTNSFMVRNLKAVILYLLVIAVTITRSMIKIDYKINNKINNKLFYLTFVSDY